MNTRLSLDAAMQALEELLYEKVSSDVATLRNASRHILQAGGKRVRPRLTLLTYLACGGQDLNAVMPVAAAVELVHTASVVHDDINDHGVVRRGRPSVNALWGRTFALLTGDFLFTKVYELMAPYRDLNVLLAEATVALVEGETLQAAAVKDNAMSRAVYYDIIARKTAALFKAAAGLGARLANAKPEVVEALEVYGFNLGLAFQIVDDILDLTVDEATLGKTAGIDLAQGKGFAVAAHGGSGTMTAAPVVEAEENDPMAAYKKKLLEGDTLNEAWQQARNLKAVALAGLSVLPETSYVEDLDLLAQMVVERDH